MPISGKEMLKRFIKAGWIKIGQVGSHVQVKKVGIDGRIKKETIPMHKELKKGTESDLLKRLKKEK